MKVTYFRGFTVYFKTLWMGPVRIPHSSHFLSPSSVISWIELGGGGGRGGKSKWIPLNFGYHEVIRTAPISYVRQGREPGLLGPAKLVLTGSRKKYNDERNPTGHELVHLAEWRAFLSFSKLALRRAEI